MKNSSSGFPEVLQSFLWTLAGFSTIFTPFLMICYQQHVTNTSLNCVHRLAVMQWPVTMGCQWNLITSGDSDTKQAGTFMKMITTLKRLNWGANCWVTRQHFFLPQKRLRSADPILKWLVVTDCLLQNMEGFKALADPFCICFGVMENCVWNCWNLTSQPLCNAWFYPNITTCFAVIQPRELWMFSEVSYVEWQE